MSGSARKRSAKWDMRDDPEFAPDSKQLRSYEDRGSNKDDIINKDYRDLDETLTSDADGSYHKKFSPGFEAWKYKRHSQSPKTGRSRSVRSNQSRSPPHGFKRDSGFNDRNRTKAGRSTQPCREFAAGKCKRGSQCNFLHHDNQNYEDSLESKHREDGAPKSTPHDNRDPSHRSGRSNEDCINFAKGRCRMGASCNFVHNNSDGYSKDSAHESTRERENDRRRRDDSFDQGGGHHRSGPTPCKFFANGNCRNGKSCRFSHDRQTYGSPNRRSMDDRWGNNPGGDYQMLDTPKLIDSGSPTGRQRDDRWGSDGNMVEKDNPKRNDAIAVSDTAKLVEDKCGNMGATDPGFTVWPTKDGWGLGLDKNRVHGEPTFLNDKKETDHRMAENAGANMCVSQPMGTSNWSDDEMSPDWNYRVGSSSHNQEEHEQSKHGITLVGTYLATQHEGTQVPVEQSQVAVPDLPSRAVAESMRNQQVSTDVLPRQGFNQNAKNINPFHSSSSHAVGQSQVALSMLPSRGIVESMHNQEVSVEKKDIVEPNITDAGLSQVSSKYPPTQNMVSNEQLAQLSNISASLAHILGTGQQLPQLCAAFNSHDAKDSHSQAKTEVPAMPVSNTFIIPDLVVGFTKQYDAMCDSIETKYDGASRATLAFSPSKKNAEDKVENPSLVSNSGRQNCGDSYKAACSKEHIVKGEHLIQLQPGENLEVKNEKNEVVVEERQNSPSDHKNAKGPSQNMDQNGGPDDAKKTKDAKGIRAFKFALVDFVKELLKPAWKEGQINKEDYKAIVKKAVDKVTGTMQSANIPQTQEKIDHYLSFSKPKLNKLVQAYVEKVQKA
ncbi:putative transcription factor C3H family [Lupinus albus]|uniref:Putative transcription factor C3H family n=1 Tax=Lupinus albus TaxID=3870 RepID=A0A6A4MWC4_LUPAL|nr:putative transcription factor C3H family [Lupinus albus]